MSNDTEMYTRLSASDLRALEAMQKAEIDALPPLETAITISWRAKALDTISSAGAVITLAIVEFVRSFGVIALVIGFAWLEFSRVKHGALAMKIEENGAILVALVFVMANCVHPIYSLSHAQKADLSVTRHTLRGGLEWLASRLNGKAITRKVDSSFNPTLAVSAFLLTMTTIVIALYDVLEPLVTALAQGTATKPTVILVTEFIMGAGMSIAGVLFLQASAHELGLRALAYDTRSPQEILAEAQATRNAEILALRERVKHEYMLAKIADEQRKKGVIAMPIVTTPHAPEYTNGNGKHTDFLALGTTQTILAQNDNGQGQG